jgi:hypothetical protein
VECSQAGRRDGEPLIREQSAHGRLSAAVPSAGASERLAPANVWRDRVRWRTVGAATEFVFVVLVSAMLTLFFIDWLLFDSPLVAPHWRLGQNDGSPSDKLLLANQYRDSEVLFLGDSRTLRGIDPAEVSKECRCGPGFNAGFSASDPGLNRLMTARLLEKMSPHTVVISVSQWELSDKARIRVDYPTRELARPLQLRQYGQRISDDDDVQMALSSLWRLYNYRGQIRASLEAWASRRPPEHTRRGYHEDREKIRVQEKDLDEGEERFFDDFSVRGRRAQELRGLIADLRSRDIEVLLIAPPLYPSFQQRVKRQVASFTETMEQIAAESGVRFVDLTLPERSGLTNRHFNDIVHLSADGAARYSRQIGKLLKGA